MRVSKKAQYGLRAMVYLAKNALKDKVCPIKEISEKEEISFDFLEKIISELEYTNKALYEINKNLANLVLIHRVQLVAIEEVVQQTEEQKDIPKKKIH